MPRTVAKSITTPVVDGEGADGRNAERTAGPRDPVVSGGGGSRGRGFGGAEGMKWLSGTRRAAPPVIAWPLNASAVVSSVISSSSSLDDLTASAPPSHGDGLGVACGMDRGVGAWYAPAPAAARPPGAPLASSPPISSSTISSSSWLEDSEGARAVAPPFGQPGESSARAGGKATATGTSRPTPLASPSPGQRSAGGSGLGLLADGSCWREGQLRQ